MKGKNEFYFLDEVFLRMPLFSITDYEIERLGEKLQEPAFRNALWLASPAFYRELEKRDFDFNRLDAGKKRSALSYYNRGCFRPTPFGAFASFSLVHWFAGRREQLRPEGRLQLHLLPDREYELAGLQAQPPVKVMLNPAIYRLGDEFRYFHSGPATEKAVFLINSVPASAANQAVIRLLRKGITDLAELTKLLAHWAGGTEPEAGAYIHFLIKEQVLLTEQQLDLVSDAESLAACRRDLPYDAELSLPQLEQERLSPRGRSTFYAALERNPVHAGPSTAEGESLLRAVAVLQRLWVAGPETPLQQYTEAFKMRFDRARVPLLLALDPDQGITYGELHQGPGESLLLDDLALARKNPPSREHHWTAVHQLFFRLWLQDAGREPAAPLVIRSADIEALPPAPAGLSASPSLSVVFRQGEDKLLMESTGGATATALLGRFSCFSREAHTLCRKIAALESAANPGVVLAEISQRSDPHIDNVNRRGMIYDYVIPVNAFCEVPAAQQLRPDDLWLSVHGQELILESGRLKKRVVPRLPTAYNYRHNELGLFRFLCDLQHQQLLSGIHLELDRLFPGLAFYPRVEFEHCMLSPATWKFTAADIAGLTARPHSLGRLHLFRQQYHLPSRLIAGIGDRQLVFDLSNDDEAFFFLDSIRDNQTTVIQEYFPPPGGQQAYAQQYLAFALNPGRCYQPVGERARARGKKRIFTPGSEWLYLKIFCTPRSSNRILAETIAPFVAQYRPNLDGWFFIRYAEQGYHLRVRLKGSPQALGGLLPELAARLQQGSSNVVVRDYQAVAYEREMERYGHDMIELAESCFRAGSDWAIYALTQLKTDFDGLDEEAALFPLVLLMARGFLVSDELVNWYFMVMAESFIANMDNEKVSRVSLDKKYRLLRPGLEKSLGPVFLDDLSAAPATRDFLGTLDCIAERAAAWKAERKRAYLADLVHMQVNRMFRFGQLNYEAVAYYCLDKFCRSVKARKNENSH